MSSYALGEAGVWVIVYNLPSVFVLYIHKTLCAHLSFMSTQIAPISLNRDFFEENVCTAFDLTVGMLLYVVGTQSDMVLKV